MATGGMNASSTSPDTSGYSGPAPTFGGGPFLSPTGGGTVNPANYTSLSDFNHAYVDQARANGTVNSFSQGISAAKAGNDIWNQYQQNQQTQPSSGGMGVARPPAGGKQAGNPMPPPSGSLDGYAQPYTGGISVNNAMTPDGGGGYTIRQPEPSYGGNSAPMFGNNPPASRSGPSMTPTPPTNPLPAPPQPQVQPAVMPPYGGGYQPGMGMERPQMSPLRQFRMGYPDRYAEMPADRMPQREMFDRGPFGRRKPPPGGPTWSQQGGVYSYDPNGRPGGGGPFGMFRNMPEGFNPFGGQMPDFATLRQQMQDYIAQRRQAPPARPGPRGLGAINPYAREEEG